MSTFLAIAAVTALLHRILSKAIAADVGNVNANVTTSRPDKVGPQTAAVNIFLTRVTPDAALGNIDLPTRGSDGDAVRRPLAALDLHYLLTFYGDESKLEPQRLLGVVVSALHSQPILTHQAIQATLNEMLTELNAQNIDPKDDVKYTSINNSGLANEVELVKFTPVSLSLEELSKLWSVLFQTPYALTVAYEASLVLIEGKSSPRKVLPVRTRELYVEPFHQPMIEQVMSQDGEERAIMQGSTLLILGKRLAGESTFVRIFGVEVSPDQMSETRISLQLSSPSVRAGVQAVQIVRSMIDRTGKPVNSHWAVESNVAAFVLRPKLKMTSVTATNVPASASMPPSVDFSVQDVSPMIGKAQRILLLLDGTSPDLPSLTFTAPARDADSTSITVRGSGVKPGDYFARIQVDGAESPLLVDEDQASPTFNRYVGPKVTVH